MGSKVRFDEKQVLTMLEEMSQLARLAKRISEITDAMDNIALQTTLVTLNASVIGRSDRDLGRMGGTVKDAAEDMYSQFNLLLEEVAELTRYVESRRQLQEAHA